MKCLEIEDNNVATIAVLKRLKMDMPYLMDGKTTKERECMR